MFAASVAGRPAREPPQTSARGLEPTDITNAKRRQQQACPRPDQPRSALAARQARRAEQAAGVQGRTVQSSFLGKSRSAQLRRAGQQQQQQQSNSRSYVFARDSSRGAAQPAPVRPPWAFDLLCGSWWGGGHAVWLCPGALASKACVRLAGMQQSSRLCKTQLSSPGCTQPAQLLPTDRPACSGGGSRGGTHSLCRAGRAQGRLAACTGGRCSHESLGHAAAACFAAAQTQGLCSCWAAARGQATQAALACAPGRRRSLRCAFTERMQLE